MRVPRAETERPIFEEVGPERESNQIGPAQDCVEHGMKCHTQTCTSCTPLRPLGYRAGHSSVASVSYDLPSGEWFLAESLTLAEDDGLLWGDWNKILSQILQV